MKEHKKPCICNTCLQARDDAFNKGRQDVLDEIAEDRNMKETKSQFIKRARKLNADDYILCSKCETNPCECKTEKSWEEELKGNE